MIKVSTIAKGIEVVSKYMAKRADLERAKGLAVIDKMHAKADKLEVWVDTVNNRVDKLQARVNSFVDDVQNRVATRITIKRDKYTAKANVLKNKALSHDLEGTLADKIADKLKL